MTSGLFASAAAVAVAVVLGVIWRWNNGRMREPRQAGRAAAAAPAIEIEIETGPASWLPGPAAGDAAVRDGVTGGSVAVQDGPAGSGPAGSGQPAGRFAVSAADIGQPLGSRATLLQFSSAFCAPCRATRRILAEVAGLTEGVAHIDIDAESRLDLVRQLDVRRTPTVFVLGPDGRIGRRASGQPRKADVIAALGTVV